MALFLLLRVGLDFVRRFARGHPAVGAVRHDLQDHGPREGCPAVPAVRSGPVPVPPALRVWADLDHRKAMLVQVAQPMPMN